MLQSKAVNGMIISGHDDSVNCEPCYLSKSTRQISRRPRDPPRRLLSVVHVDIVGKLTPVGLHGECYWLLITDGKTRRRWIFFSDSKAVLGQKLIDWCT